MRKLIVTEFISVDGIAEVEKLPSVTWSDEMQKFKEDELADSGAMLLGRTTYEIFAGSWPKENRRFRRPVQRAAEVCRVDELEGARLETGRAAEGRIAGSGQATEARQRRQHLCAWQPQRRAGIAAP